MSTDCENLLKRFLVLNPGKRGTLEVGRRQCSSQPQRLLRQAVVKPNQAFKSVYLILFQQIMKDRWINAGSEVEELKPFIQPDLDIRDQARIGRAGLLCSENEQEPIRSQDLISCSLCSRSDGCHGLLQR